MTQVLVTGTFNILHAGHCELLEFAARFGKVTVGINNDPYLKVKYGDRAVPLVNRAYVLKCNRFVDRVVVFTEDEPSALIRQLRPETYIKGPDYQGAELPETHACNDVGTQILIHGADKIGNASELVQVAPPSTFIKLDFLD
jgi:cytidyltransferase-like protein